MDNDKINDTGSMDESQSQEAEIECDTTSNERIEQEKEETKNTENDEGTESNASSGSTEKRINLSRTEAIVFALILCCLTYVIALATISLSSTKNRVIINQVTREQQYDESVTAENVSDVSGKDKPMTMEQLYEKLVDSCVGINISSNTTNFWGYTSSIAVAGSGFILSEDGYIATNYHVVEDSIDSNSAEIMVKMHDGKEYVAKLIGGEPDRDVAILKIDATGLKPVVLGDSSVLRVGQEVVTIGNPLGELDFSLTNGIVSALDRIITTGLSYASSSTATLNMLQTNCVINSGNSGGPLFNVYGEVIGITTAKYSSSSTGEAAIEGLGFAIPINDVSRVLADIIAYGYVTGKPYLGISIESVSAEAQRYGVSAGAYVSSVKPGSCSEKAGIKVGDIIVALGDKTIDSGNALRTAVASYMAGDKVVIKVVRNSEEIEFTVVLDEKEADVETQVNNTPRNQVVNPGYYDWPFDNMFNW